MQSPGRKWAMFALRWGIAIVGVWWVVSNMSLRDKVWVLDEANLPMVATLAEPAEENEDFFTIWDPQTGQRRSVPRQEVVNPPEQRHQWITARVDGDDHQLEVMALDMSDDLKRIRRLLVKEAGHPYAYWITPGQVVGEFAVKVPRPRVDVGLIGILSAIEDPESWAMLTAALFVMPLTYLITSYRWNRLLRALDIRLTQARTFVLNMVGAFYNTFLPGSTGGDFLKAYYASKQTDYKARAVLSVFIDRVIGLLGLVLLGGLIATYQYITASGATEATLQLLKGVAIGSGLIFAGVFAALIVFGFSGLRRVLGIDFILRKLPLQKQVQHAIQVARIYRARPGLVIWALLITLPVHLTVCISAMFAGKALNLPIPAAYYFVSVPVIVLAGAIPISPQGAGVMEFFAIQLTRQYGTTVSQAFALTMSIRLVQIFWNLTGGLFVLRGGYHAPTVAEQEELEREEAREAGEDPILDPTDPKTAPS